MSPMLYQIDNYNTTDPRVNLALEEFCIRRLPADRNYLLLYVNDPAVIIGRHQNPLEESDQRYTDRHRIQTVRRVSGGGTVYHDNGNLNFCFVYPFDRMSLSRIKDRIAPILHCLRGLGIEAHLDDRNAIFIGHHKVSGNSQFSNTRRILVHGTLLFQSDLKTLNSALRPSLEDIVSDSPKSNRSPVTNISAHLNRIMDLNGFQQHLLQAISDGAGGLRKQRLTAEQWSGVNHLAKTKYASWQWNYGKTPPFKVHKSLLFMGKRQAVTLLIKNGMIQAVDLSPGAGIGETRRMVLKDLTGIRYNEKSIFRALETSAIEKSITPSVINQLKELVY